MFWQPLIKIIELKYDLDVVLSMFVEETYKSLAVDACSIFLLEDDKMAYTLSASTLVPTVKSGMIYIDAKEDLIGRVALREEQLTIANIDEAKQHSVLQTLSRTKFYSLLAAPIIYKSEVIAILVLQMREKKQISESLQTDVATLCANLSPVLNRAINIEEVYDQIEEKPTATLSFDGTSTHEGGAKGIAFARYNITDIENIPYKKSQSEDEEALFNKAVEKVRSQLEKMLDRITYLAGNNEKLLFEAYLHMIDSSRFYDAIIAEIRKGIWVQTAIKKVVLDQVTAFENMNEPYFVERASDIRDLGKRILLALENNTIGTNKYPSNTILVASEVTASMIAEVPKGRLRAVITEQGSAYSHAAIIAKALSVPFITNISALPVSFIDGKEIIVDGYIGRIYIHPNAGLRTAYNRIIESEFEKVSALQKIKDLPNETLDGHRLDLNANIGLVADVDRAIAQGATTIGLYRSEVPFMIRDRFPSEDEQRIIYHQVLEAFPHEPIVIRALDVGADKTLPYFYESEQNPALGWRGIRMMLDHSDLFLTQIRAMLKASSQYNNLNILLPMITTIEEIKEAKALIRQAYKELIEEGFEVKPPGIGVMIEVPSVVLLIDQILKLVDFISIGSNDLTQYILAVDRSNNKVASIYNQLHPAMIRVFYYVVKTVLKHNKTVSLCGEIGGNPLATPLLIGIGFSSLSMNATNILKVKQVLRHVTQKQCRNVLRHVLKLTTVKEVHTYLESFLVENNLGGLIRAGKNH